MKKIILILTIASVLTSCNSQSKKSNEMNHKKETTIAEFNNYDLINLKFNENINDILKVVKLNLKDNQETDAFTLFGNKKFESKSDSFLLFRNKKLTDKENINNIIIHYSKDNNIIGMIQIDLKNQTDLKNNLIFNLGKSNKEYHFESITESYYWLKNGNYYYFFQKNDKDDPYNVLFIFKDKIWIDFISNLGYGGEYMKK
ncbi:MAG: hypothetical protein QM535_00045 [Limnohabitans sp.]|nr:hypothetical protein [Limnohabitans sp.]